MRKLFFLPIILTLLNFAISCSKDNLEEPIVDKPMELVNKAPNDFEITIKSVTDKTAILNWQKAIDPDNDSVTYTIYLGQTIILDNATSLECKLTGLNELTNYTGKIIAKDSKNNQTIKNFSFNTNKFFLKFIKAYDYADGQSSKHGSPFSMIKTNDGKYVIAGSSNFNDNGAQFFVLKTDYQGNELWKKFYGYQIGSSNNFKITQTSNGFILAGYHHILNIDNDGNIKWHKELFSYDTSGEIKSVKVDTFGNIFLVGIRGTSINPEIMVEGVLTKLDNSGNVIWEKTFGSSLISGFEDLIITSSNNLIILGSTETSGTTREQFIKGPSSVVQMDFWVLNINNNGEKIWQKTYGDGKYDFPSQIIATRDGNYVFTGYSWGAYDISYRSLFKIDKEGNIIWGNANNTSSTSIFSVAETSDNGYILAGTLGFGSYDDAGLFKYDSNGNPVWEKIYREDYTHLRGYAVVAEDDNGFRIAATRFKYNYYDGDRPKLLVYKTDPEGNIAE
jgi:hypothetical protein